MRLTGGLWPVGSAWWPQRGGYSREFIDLRSEGTITPAAGGTGNRGLSVVVVL